MTGLTPAREGLGPLPGDQAQPFVVNGQATNLSRFPVVANGHPMTAELAESRVENAQVATPFPV